MKNCNFEETERHYKSSFNTKCKQIQTVAVIFVKQCFTLEHLLFLR